MNAALVSQTRSPSGMPAPAGVYRSTPTARVVAVVSAITVNMTPAPTSRNITALRRSPPAVLVPLTAAGD
ncbi:hypothetical protein GCM10022419_085300 [Nonomuraea rosea]|uniref:Uncharacterized protein n=1 Tax=Nonomuraea rosea TaxID=638574 RepID=A0ABP6YTB9_9ACTN